MFFAFILRIFFFDVQNTCKISSNQMWIIRDFEFDF